MARPALEGRGAQASGRPVRQRRNLAPCHTSPYGHAMTKRMPAEWAPHDWLWIGFPGDPDEWPVLLGAAQRQVAAFANAVHAGGRGEAVRLVARRQADAAIARSLIDEGVTVLVESFGDIWLRDTGPICTMDGRTRL